MNRISTKIIDCQKNIEKYFEVIGKKTAELFGASCESGVIVANGNVKQQKAAYN